MIPRGLILTMALSLLSAPFAAAAENDECCPTCKELSRIGDQVDALQAPLFFAHFEGDPGFHLDPVQAGLAWNAGQVQEMREDAKCPCRQEKDKETQGKQERSPGWIRGYSISLGSITLGKAKVTWGEGLFSDSKPVAINQNGNARSADMAELNEMSVVLGNRGPVAFGYVRDFFARHPELHGGSGLSDQQLLALIEADFRARYAAITSDGVLSITSSSDNPQKWQYALDDSVIVAQMRANLSQGIELYRLVGTVHGGPEFLANLRDSSKSWSRDQRVQIGRLLGYLARRDFDQKRDGLGPNRHGVVTDDQILAAMMTGGKAGVCRDIASFQADAMKAMGFDNCWVRGYVDAETSHATVICQDILNPRQTLQFDYGALRTTDDRGGAAAISQDGDVGTETYFCKPGGKCVGHMPTELGKLLEEATGVEQLNIFDEREPSAVGAVQFNVHGQGIEARVGQLGTGADVGILSTQAALSLRGHELGKGGIAYVYEHGGLEGLGNVNRLYGSYSATGQSRSIGSGAGSSTRFRADIVSNFSVPVTGGITSADGAARVVVSSETRFSSRDGTSVFAVKPSVEAFATYSDIRKDLSPTLAVGRKSIETDYSREDDRYRLMVTAAAATDFLGPFAMSRVSLEDLRNGRSAEIRCQGAIRSSSPEWLPGMARECSISGIRKEGDWTMRIQYVQPITLQRGRLQLGIQR